MQLLTHNSRRTNTTFFVAILLVFVSCKEEPSLISEQDILRVHLNLPSEVANYANPLLPAFFYNQFVVNQDNTPSNNRVTDWGATLGRVLFYDKQLSKNRTISCASCHQQKNGFTDTAKFSIGFEGRVTSRHSMALANATYYSNGRFFWDERATSLEEQVLEPFTDEIEMGMTMPEIVQILKSSEYYPILFENAFGTREINEIKVAKSLAQFLRSMVSYNAKYDIGRAQVDNRLSDFPNFSKDENGGKNIFMTNRIVNCFGCHNTDVFISDNARNNGLNTLSADEGTYVHTGNLRDKGTFKSPSLKNVALRGRFMHDGSLTSLREVIEHYNSQIKPNANLDPHLRDVNTDLPVRMNLTEDEKRQLELFLHTLTDNTLLTDDKYSNPFK